MRNLIKEVVWIYGYYFAMNYFWLNSFFYLCYYIIYLFWAFKDKHERKDEEQVYGRSVGIYYSK